jgi:DtxR family Mn-dependent transcriptional regulator
VITLDQLAVNESAAVVGISPACRGPQRRRLLDLGVVPGTEIRAVMRSAAGDPIAYDIRGALIALRHEQAEWIRVRRAPTEVAA